MKRIHLVVAEAMGMVTNVHAMVARAEEMLAPTELQL